MGKHVSSPNKVEPAIHLLDQAKVENESGKDLFLEIGNITSKVEKSREKVFKETEAADGVKSLFQMGYYINSIITAVYYYLKSLISHPKKNNQFFYKEEQRKYELEIQLRKNLPHELINSSFIQRRDL